MIFYKEAFKSLRISAQLTQEDIAKKLGVSKTAVSYWEREDRPEKPRPTRAYKLAEVLGCSVVDFSDLAPEKWLIEKPEVSIPDDIDFNRLLSIWPKLTESMRSRLVSTALELLEKSGHGTQPGGMGGDCPQSKAN